MIPKKTTSVDTPYQIWLNPRAQWEWRVLKSYQKDDSKPYARWYCAVKSPYTYDSWEFGDVYVKDVKDNAMLAEDNT